MSLPAPNLDDRTFQDIVDDAKRRIGLYCPEWTDHNVSDPGVTLIELFAWMTEMTMFRLNQVPERNYIHFLEMLGIHLEPPTPARTELRFHLARPIADEDGEEAFETVLPAFETVCATIRTETEEAVEFTTEEDLPLTRPRLLQVFSVPEVDWAAADTTLPSLRRFEFQMFTAEDDATPSNGFPIFAPSPTVGDTLCMGFENDISSQIIGVDADCLQSAATGLDELYPSQVWEYWDGAVNRWNRLEVLEDTTFGFNRRGRVQLAMPRGLTSRTLAGQTAYWVRCRYTTLAEDLPQRLSDGRIPQTYRRSPEVTRLQVLTLGGIAPASNAETVLAEELGLSDGTPGQRFRVRNAPLLPRLNGETVLVGAEGTEFDEREVWHEVVDFAESTPDDRHFTWDSFSGEIAFGPRVVAPDGTVWQHGRIPAQGLIVTVTRYRFGGGTRGNVRNGEVNVLKSSIPYIASVDNPNRATGGRDMESLDHAKLRAQSLLRVRNRAVTAEDFEFLTLQASAGVGRARCITASPTGSSTGGAPPPGVVRVLVIPALGDDVLTPLPSDLRVAPHTMAEVREYLDERRLLTTVLDISTPDYVYVSTDILLIAKPGFDPEQVRRRVRERLERFIHPLYGGHGGSGWPFRRALTLADIYSQIEGSNGVAFLRNVRISVSRMINATDGLLGQEARVSLNDGVRLGPAEMLCSREHRVIVRPMTALEQEEEAE